MHGMIMDSSAGLRPPLQSCFDHSYHNVNNTRESRQCLLCCHHDILMFIAIVHPVYLMNVGQCQEAADS